MSSKPRWDAQVFDHRFPVRDGLVSTARAGAAAGERVAEGHVPGVDNLNSEKMAEAKKEGAVVSSDDDETHERNLEILHGATPAGAADSGMSWGKVGSTETSAERGSESIAPGARTALGIDPQGISQSTSPEPSDFGKPLRPVSDHSQGNWNMADIIRGHK
jgi:hypothetical protein